MIEKEDIYSIEKLLSEYEGSGLDLPTSEKKFNGNINIEIYSTIKIPVPSTHNFEDFKQYLEEHMDNLYKQTKSKSEIIKKTLEGNSKESLIRIKDDQINKLVSENEELKNEIKKYQEEIEMLRNSIKEIEDKYDYNNKSNLQLKLEREIFDVGQKSNISKNNKYEQNKEINQLKNNRNESNLDILLIQGKELEEKLKVKGEEKNFAECFRKEYNLEEKDYPDEKIINALKENDYDKEEAFDSFFK